MAFQLVSTTLVLLFLILNFNRRVVANFLNIPHPLPVYDATPKQLKAIHEQGFIPLEEVKVHTWEDTYSAVMKGQGVNIQRKSDVQAEWNKFRSNHKGEMDQLENEIIENIIKWGKFNPNWEIPKVLTPELIQDARWVKFTVAQYPINVPRDVEHHILWLRAPMTTPETFLAREGETIPDERWLVEDYQNQLIEFIHAHDAFDSNVGLNTELKIGEGLRKSTLYNGKIQKEEGLKAMRWASRYITELIQHEFYGKGFAWFRVNRELRSFHVPNEIHVLVHNSGK